MLTGYLNKHIFFSFTVILTRDKYFITVDWNIYMFLCLIYATEQFYLRIILVCVINVCNATIILWTVRMSLYIDTGHIFFLYFIIPKWSKNKYAEKKIDFVVLFFFYCKHYKWSSPVGSYRDVLKSTKYHLWFPLFHTKIVIHICVDFRNWQGWLEIPGYRSVETFSNLQKKTKKRGLHDIIMMSDWNFHIKRKISKK